MKYFDTYDENGIFVSSQDEEDVHYKGLWHKVVRVWLYDSDGNLYLRKRKEDGKLDTINELHVLSSESLVTCFDRGIFEKLGIHFPSDAEFTEVSEKKVKVHKVYTDNSEFKDNYILCDCIGEFDGSVSFFIYNADTSGLVRVSARGISNLLSTRTGEVVAMDVLPGGAKGSKITIKTEDIFESSNEDTYLKYNNVVRKIVDIIQTREQERIAEERRKRLAGKKKNSKDIPDEEIVSKADDNEGSDLY